MSDPHNPARIGEKWNQERIDLMEREIRQISKLVPILLSGGWAWHFISQRPHDEIKIFHDHKDIDIFIEPTDFPKAIQCFTTHAYVRAKTQHDDPSGDFYRYTKYFDVGKGKIVFDVFLEEFKVMGYVEIDGMKIVDPKYLISLYSTKHDSKECVAVIEAKKLIAKGISPIGRKELTTVKI
jgi:hypothetical protein